MLEQSYLMQQVEEMIRLVKRGDVYSLVQLREQLGKNQKEVALKIGIPEHQLIRWETGEEEPSKINHAHWRIKLSDYIDDVICELLGTDDVEINTQFWELIWKLTD